jgi:glutamine synthetase
MGKQEDFVLRALEERDVRFVRLWFTDVLGSLKSVAIAPAELDRGLRARARGRHAGDA